MLFFSTAACSEISISDLRTQAGADDKATLTRLQSGKFDLLPLNREKPFSEELALDAVKNNLLARGYQLDKENPDFLVAVWYDLTSRAEARLAPPFRAMGWYRPRFDCYDTFAPWFGMGWDNGYTQFNNYAIMSIAFLHPASREELEQKLNNPELQHTVPKADIYWRGQAYVKSSRNAFTVLSCLAAGILDQFPDSGAFGSKAIPLAQCH